MNEIVTRQETEPVRLPMPAQGNVGAIAIESERAVAEARGQMQLARMFPRDLNASYAEIMEVCKLQSMANIAFYTVPQGGQKVTGPSIKLIEQIAASCEHFEWGHRELSRIDATASTFGRSEIEVFAWDKQKNNMSKRQITVLHVLDTKDGPRKLRDQREIDNKIANVASKQMRGRLQALLPKWIIEAAVEECKKTLTGTNSEPISVRVRRMTQAFAQYGVNVDHLEKYIGHKLDDMVLDELVDLTGVFNALREGAKPSEYFSADAEPANDNTKAPTPQITAASEGKPHAAVAAAEKRRAKAPADTQAPEPKPAAAEEPPAAQVGDPGPAADSGEFF